ncbi:MAG: IS4 family transposase [Bacteroidota bacterium]
MNEVQISSKIAELELEELAKASGFIQRSGGKITALDFVSSFFLMVSTGKNTLVNWAMRLSMLIKKAVSDKAIDHKLQFRQVEFSKQVLQASLESQSKKAISKAMKIRHLSAFDRVYVEDSVCVSLPDNVAEFFPGAFSVNGEVATARIQFRLELKTNRYEHLALQSYRHSDAKFAPNIISGLQVNDLVLRDQGYWSLDVFEKIIESKAYFISRYRHGVHLFDAQTGESIDLLKVLKAKQRNGIRRIELQILVGKEKKLPLRLVAVEVPHQVAQKRRRKAAKSRNKRVNYSKEYMALLGWSIFVTNVEQELLDAKQIMEVYGMRWRIENLFKCWKSAGLQIAQLFADKQSMRPPRAMITLYLLLSYLVLFFAKWFYFFERKVFEKYQRPISIFKFIDWVVSCFDSLFNSDDLTQWVDLVAYHCKYDKRKDRQNMGELLYVIN